MTAATVKEIIATPFHIKYNASVLAILILHIAKPTSLSEHVQ
jgi:hypothetical protein